MSSRKQTSEAASSRSNRCGSKEEVSGSDAGSSGDKLFEPSLDMMVNDFDDESTLELEEQMASTEAEDPNAELNSLQRVWSNGDNLISQQMLIECKLTMHFRKTLFYRKVICLLRNY